MGREKFLERVWEWKTESGGTIVNQLKRLGASCDWSRERFTMDEGLSKAVLKVFVDLYEAGLIYKYKRLVNWDPEFQSAVSDLEVDMSRRPALTSGPKATGKDATEASTRPLWQGSGQKPIGPPLSLRYPLKARVLARTRRPISSSPPRARDVLGDTASPSSRDERYKGARRETSSCRWSGRIRSSPTPIRTRPRARAREDHAGARFNDWEVASAASSRYQHHDDRGTHDEVPPLPASRSFERGSRRRRPPCGLLAKIR